MNTCLKSCALASLLCSPTAFGQQSVLSPTNATGTYAADLGAVTEAQDEALTQAKEMLEQMQNASLRSALQAAIKEMQRSKAALALAQHTPDKLPAAVAAQQAAYQALLKIIPHETRVSRSGSRGQSGQRAGQAGSEQINQLEMTDEESRYETERQAQAAPNAQQREQLQVADRLKELAQRQQDLNERLTELQTALPEARTEKEREEARRQLKRLSDEERQLLADMDELGQQMEQSPNANSLANTRQQMDQTRSDTQRAAQEMDNQSPSQALAAGARAQQELQNLRQDLKSKTSGRFTAQMRQIRSEARDLSSREDELARGLDSLANANHKSLDDSAPRQQLSEQMARQQSALTNLLSQMQNLTEQAETTEPLLSQQLYDTLRRESQTHTEDYIQAGEQLVDRGLISQASQVERLAHQNINDLRQRVERAAESVLGNEADSLQFAQKELDDLAGQLQRELAGAETNSNSSATSQSNSNLLPRAIQSASVAGGTNLAANHASSGAQGSREGQETSSENSPVGPPSRNDSGNERADDGRGKAARSGDGQNAAGQNLQQGGAESAAGGGGGRTAEDLGNLVRQFGGGRGAGGLNRGVGGPITGNDFVDWSSRMRDVEQVLDDAALRSQLATARERVAAMRAEFRQSNLKPKSDLVRRQILDPITEVRSQVREDLARLSNAKSLVPLDHDPVPENYSELVRKYYEKLGGEP